MGKIPIGSMGYEEGWASELPEILIGIPEIYRDKRENGTTSGMRAVDGYYRVKEGEMPVRQINVYDEKTDEKALERAKADGLLRPLLIEIVLGEPQPCTLFNQIKRERDKQ
jgi:hypothetical protein